MNVHPRACGLIIQTIVESYAIELLSPGSCVLSTVAYQEGLQKTEQSQNTEGKGETAQLLLLFLPCLLQNSFHFENHYNY